MSKPTYQQVHIDVALTNISVAYRNGTSPVARLVIEQVGRKVKQMITPTISNALTHDAHVINI